TPIARLVWMGHPAAHPVLANLIHHGPQANHGPIVEISVAETKVLDPPDIRRTRAVIARPSTTAVDADASRRAPDGRLETEAQRVLHRIAPIGLRLRTDLEKVLKLDIRRVACIR